MTYRPFDQIDFFWRLCPHLAESASSIFLPVEAQFGRVPTQRNHILLTPFPTLPPLAFRCSNLVLHETGDHGSGIANPVLHKKEQNLGQVGFMLPTSNANNRILFSGFSPVAPLMPFAIQQWVWPLLVAFAGMVVWKAAESYQSSL